MSGYSLQNGRRRELAAILRAVPGESITLLIR